MILVNKGSALECNIVVWAWDCGKKIIVTVDSLDKVRVVVVGKEGEWWSDNLPFSP